MKTIEQLTDDANIKIDRLHNAMQEFNDSIKNLKQFNELQKEEQELILKICLGGIKINLDSKELSGVYLAVLQMLSKGKVTIEELRRSNKP